MKRFLFFISIVICFFMFACIGIGTRHSYKGMLQIVDASTNCSLTSGASSSTIQSALTAASGGTCTGTANGNTVLLNAGTYTISPTLTFPCNAILTGPVVPYSQTPNQTAIVNGSSSSGGNGFSSTSGCNNSPGEVIEYIQWNGEHSNTQTNGGGLIDLNAGTTNFTITHNYLHGGDTYGADYNSTSYASIQVIMSGSGTNTTNNINITWNQFGAQTFGDCSGAFRDNTSSPNGGSGEQNNGSDCNGVGISNAVSNIYINNNNFSYLEEPIKVYESGSTPSCNNVVMNNNSFTQYYRIMIETQCYTPGPVLMYIQYNATQTKWGGSGQSNIWSDAWSIANGCSNTAQSNCETHDDYNNLLETNSIIPGNTGNELWGSGVQGSNPPMSAYATQTTAIYNLFQGYWGNGIIWSPAGNFILSFNTFNINSGSGSDTNCIDHAGGYWNVNIQNGNVPAYTPACVGNTFSSATTGTYTSAAPSIPASQSFGSSMTVTLSTTGTNRDINTTDWCTTDGSTPVVGGSAVSSGNTAQPYWTSVAAGLAPTTITLGTITITSTTTVKCIGMWGAPNQPYAYPSGYSYVPSAVVSATYTGGSATTATPVLNPTTEVFYPGPLAVTVTDGTSGAQIYCTNTAGTTGTTPTPSSPLYSGAFSLSATATIECMATSSGAANSTVVVGTYTLGSSPVAATPVISPSSETFYPGPLSVTVTDSTSGAVIYCTNGPTGTVPSTSSPVYSGALTVAATATVECMATASGYSQSAVSQTTYTLSSGTQTYGVTTETGVAVSQPNYWVGTYVTLTGTLTNITGYIYLGSGGTIGDKFDFIVVPSTGYNSMATSASCHATFTETTGTINGWQPITLPGCTLTAGIDWIGYDTNDGGMSEGQNDCGGTTSAPTCPTGQANISSPNWGAWYAALTYGNYTFPTTYSGQQAAQTSLYMIGSPPAAVATPVFSPASESFSGTVTVSITDSTAGSTITWCMSTSPNCTPTTTYTGPVAVPGPTFYAVAVATASGYTTSAQATATYTYVAPATMTSCAMTAAGSATTLIIGGSPVQMTGQCTYSTTANIITGTTTQDQVSSSAVNVYSADYFIVGSSAITPQTATIYIGTGTSGSKIDVGITQATSPTAQSTNVLCYATITESGQANQLITVPITGCGTLAAGYTGFVWMNTNDPALTVGKQDCGGSCSGSATSTTYGDCSSTVTYGTYTGIGTAFSSTCPGQYQRLQYITSTSSAGGSTTLACSAGADANGGQITTWSTSASGIMSMGSFGGLTPGIVTGLAAGTANATAIATQGTTTLNCTPYQFTVSAPSATLTGVTITLQSGGTNIILGSSNNQACVNMTYTSPTATTQECGSGLDMYGNGAGTSWESLGTGLITTTTAGVLTGVSVGNATIEATVGSFTPTLNVGVLAVSPTAPTTIKGLKLQGLTAR